MGFDSLPVNPHHKISIWAPWTPEPPHLHVDIWGKSDTANPAVTYIQAIEFINSIWSQSLHVYTDGSKEASLGRTATAIRISDFRVVRAFRLRNHLSVFSTKLFAIVLAPQWIIELSSFSVVILSDSLSAFEVLESLQDGCGNDLVLEV